MCDYISFRQIYLLRRMLSFALLSAVLVASATAANVYPEPPPTLDPQPHTTWEKLGHKGSRKARINVPFTGPDGSADSVDMYRLDLVGDAKARGFAHGFLMAKEIAVFTGPAMDKFYMDEVLNIDLSGLPEGLQKIFRVIQVKGALAAPAVFKAAMKWVWEQEKEYVPQALVDEMDAMGEGMCASPLAPEKCVASEWADNIKTLNMLPELIRMACTAYGAWGKATGGKGLTQVRALDFGGGPFANYTVVQVHRPGPGAQNFVSVAFPGFAGVITGVSERGVGISEKVWMTYDKPSTQPGEYNGEADVFVLRDLLEYSKNKAEAEKYIQSVRRTWGMWVGIGDYETQTLDLVAYRAADAVVYTDETINQMTGQPFIEHVAYVDKHPQPTHDGVNGSLPTALSDHYGNINSETAKVVNQFHKTGDLHIAHYDFTAKTMYVSIGRINKNGGYGPEGGDLSVWKAYNRPYLNFKLSDLWAGK